MKTCSIDGCNLGQCSKGLCSKHYQKLRKYGDPHAGKTYGAKTEPVEKFLSIRPRKNGECREWPMELSTRGYGVFRAERKVKHQAHRFAWELSNGPIPKGMFIDHICHNRACVNVEHLRLATVKQNAENLSVVRSKSGYRGVYERNGKWTASVKHEGINRHLGVFLTAEEANEAAIKARNALFTHNVLDRT